MHIYGESNLSFIDGSILMLEPFFNLFLIHYPSLDFFYNLRKSVCEETYYKALDNPITHFVCVPSHVIVGIINNYVLNHL